MPNDPSPERQRPRRANRIGTHAALALALLAAAVPALALSTDKDQPVEIEADYAELDDLHGVTIYKGSVVVIQGSMRMTGDLLTVDYDDANQIDTAVLNGRPARFHQKPDTGEQTDGEGARIEYHAKQSLMLLIKDARLTQGGKLLSGHRISYDTERGIVTARRAPGETAAPGTTPGTPGRIKVIIPPKKKPECTGTPPVDAAGAPCPTANEPASGTSPR
ncbi:MAG: lipopolysaccharide transport periplasmic protein LptA [Gammaproteobacteria bacterium]